MAYATRAGMIERYGEQELVERTDRVGAGVIDQAVLDRATADADAQVDGYLAVRYSLPLHTVPGFLVRIACSIARYMLWEDLASERVRQEYEDARRLLESIAAGRASLGLPESETNPGGNLAEAVAGRAKAWPGGVI